MARRRILVVDDEDSRRGEEHGDARPRVSLEAWTALWKRLGARSDPRPLQRAIHRAYREPHRHYHTLEHIARILTLFDGVRPALQRADEAELALWLHDVVYDPRGSDNEERSAAWARRILDEAGVDAARAGRVSALILATRHQAPPDDHDAHYVVEADLSILGAPAADFDRYERQVRREYAFMNDGDWRHRRAGRLRGFLERPRIFQTPGFAPLEEPARANLCRSLDLLRPSRPDHLPEGSEGRATGG